MNIQIDCAYPLAELYENVRVNSRTCSRWLLQSDKHEGHAILVGGGPSLADNLDKIKWRHGLGQKIFALNGSCRLLNEHGIIPDYQVFLDANKEMDSRVGKADHYLVAAQCAPEMFAALPAENTTLWHFGLPDVEQYIPDHDESFSLIGAGGTIGLTAMCLAFTMGYRKLHLYGYDSSNRDGKDHAYVVPLTEERLGNQILNSVKVTYGKKVFETTLSMAHQAEMFPKVCNNLIDAGCTITVDVDKNSLLMAVIEDVRANSEPVAA